MSVKKGDALTAEMLNSLSGGGTPEPNYETVAEFTAYSMTQGAPGLPESWYYTDVADKAFVIDEDETYYLNGPDHPSDGILVLPQTATLILYNAKAVGDDLVPLDESKPSYAVITTYGETYLGFTSTTNAMEGETVRILKKVEHCGGGDLIVTATMTKGSEVYYTLSDFSVGLEEIFSAVASNRTVKIYATYLDVVFIFTVTGLNPPDVVFASLVADLHILNAAIGEADGVAVGEVTSVELQSS